MDYAHLMQADPELYASMARELERQRDHLELIASENFTSQAVMEAVGSHLTNKYAEGYPGARYYGGCEYVDEVERLAIERVTRLFGADHANVQPHSGSQANMAVYAALLQPGDRILGMNLSHGGHLTHGSKASLSGKYFEAHFYGVDPETETIDYEALARTAEEVRPKLIIAGASTFLGMAGKLILPDLASSNNVIAALVVELFPHGLKGLVLIGVLSAIMSTADISVLTGSASLTKDIYQRYFHPEASEKTLMRVGLAASLLVGVLGAVFGWFTQDIMNILLITFTINSAGLFLPTIGAFFWKKSCSAGAFASMLSATIIAIVWFIGGKVSALPLFSIDALWPSFGVSAVLYVVICLTHRQTPEEQEQAERFYAAR